MFLKDRNSGELVEVLTIKNLFDPFLDEVAGRYQQGEEIQDPVQLRKTELIFPSGEVLPKCWLDPHYRDG
jgi:hypothetical protein|tara:strand:+ start:231 stop:440 length:210 start_codon:yes stop_codon:yes gene_type:complete